MRQLLLVLVCLFIFPVSSFAQSAETFDIATFHSPIGWKKQSNDGVLQAAETFDISSFQPPKGWEKQASQDSIQFSTSDEAKGAFCLITLFRSVPGTDNSKENFSAAWQTIVKEAVNVTAAPQMFPSDNKEDWKVEGGFAPFEKNGEKGVAVLYTASGYGKMVNALVLTNTQAYEPTITAFLNSISFKKPDQSTTARPAEAGSETMDVVGSWGAASSNQSSYAVSNGLGGSIKKQYTFSPNGTYEFLVKTFQYTMRNLLFTKETGTYQLNGNSLTLIPQKGYIQEWTKAAVVDNTGRRSETDNWGKLVSTRATTLEKVTYQISKRYFSGIQEWQLVMQASKQTERDGPFTTNADFPNSWLYGTQKYPIVPPQ